MLKAPSLPRLAWLCGLQPQAQKAEEQAQRCTTNISSIDERGGLPSSAGEASTSSTRTPTHCDMAQDNSVQQLVSYLTLGNSRLKCIASQGLVHACQHGPQGRVVQVLACCSNSDVASTLISMLQGSNEQGKVHAAHLLQKALSDPSASTELFELGVVPALVAAARNSSTAAARKAALRVLSRLARQQEASDKLVACQGHEVSSWSRACPLCTCPAAMHHSTKRRLT
jgi:hypothetical protein